MAGAKPKPPPISVSYLEEDIHNDSLACENIRFSSLFVFAGYDSLAFH